MRTRISNLMVGRRCRAAALLLLIVSVLVPFPGMAQITNGIKASQLGTAATFNGTENLFMWQVVNSTNRTAWATLSQVLAPALTIGTATTNGLAALLVTEATARAGVSNFLVLVTGTNATALTTASNYFALRAGTNATATTTASNYLALVAGTNATALTTASNYLALVAATNAANIATALTNSLPSFTNGTAAIYAASVAAKVIRSTSKTNSTINISAYGSGSTTNYLLDFSAGSQQMILVTAANVNPNQTISFFPTNYQDGQTFTLLLKKPTAATYWVTTPLTVTGATIIGGGAAIGVYPSTGNGALLNWLVIGTNIVFSGGSL